MAKELLRDAMRDSSKRSSRRSLVGSSNRGANVCLIARALQALSSSSAPAFSESCCHKKLAAAAA